MNQLRVGLILNKCRCCPQLEDDQEVMDQHIENFSSISKYNWTWLLCIWTDLWCQWQLICTTYFKSQGMLETYAFLHSSTMWCTNQPGFPCCNTCCKHIAVWFPYLPTSVHLSKDHEDYSTPSSLSQWHSLGQLTTWSYSGSLRLLHPFVLVTVLMT